MLNRKTIHSEKSGFPFRWALLGTVLSVALSGGCSQQELMLHHAPGTAVEFGVSSGYGKSESPATRTEYSGETFSVSGSDCERIDWVDGDRLSICCPAAEGSVKKSDYTVQSHTASSHRSDASIAPASGSGLQWGTGRHVFYAMYPAASAPGVDPAKIYMDENVLHATIPSAQEVTNKPGTHTWLPDMDYACMFAATTVEAGSVAGPVSLFFRPMVTALEFTVDSEDPELELYGFELVSSQNALTGDFIATVTEATGENAVCTYTLPSRTEENSRITIDFGGPSAPLVITQGNPVTFTVLALPQELTGLTATFITSKGKRKLDMSWQGGAPVSFSACRKSRIVTPGVPGKMYDFVLTGNLSASVSYKGGWPTLSVCSYRKRITTGEVSPAPWRIEGFYSDASCTTPYDGADSSRRPDWLFSITESGAGVSAATDNEVINTMVKPQRPTMIPNDLTLALRAKPEVGSMDAPVDLSMLRIPFDPASPAGSRSTANSYVVTDPGWYEFPVVYGNAIKDDVANESAWKASGTGTGVLYDLVRHDENPITAPWIKDNGLVPASASLVWQDWKDEVLDRFLVEEVSLHGDFIRFHVPQESIHEGNAVIAVKDAGGDILWSWHIWVTSQTLSVIPVQNNWVKAGSPAGGQEWFSFLSDNLGSVLKSEDLDYAQRRVYIRLSNAGTVAVARLTQDHGFVPVSDYNCPFYQWGRKDPMQPSNGRGSDKAWFDASGTMHTGLFPWADWENSSESAARAEIASTIKNPGTFNYGESMDDHFTNLWDGMQLAFNYSTPSLLSTNFKKAVKTVYDPSPVGFVVPSSGAFTGFTSTGESSQDAAEFNVSGSFDKGWHFHTGLDKTGGTIFFPATGFRIGAGTGGIEQLRAVGRHSGCWSASIGNRSSSYYLYFDTERMSPSSFLLKDRAYPMRAVVE